MPPAVLTVDGSPMRCNPTELVDRIELAPGIVKEIVRDVAATREDGTGAQRSLPGGRNFTQDFQALEVGSGKDGETVLQFLQDRQNDRAAFYVYWLQVPGAVIDPTGVATLGRLLVKLLRYSYEHVPTAAGPRINIYAEYEEDIS